MTLAFIKIYNNLALNLLALARNIRTPQGSREVMAQ